MKFDWLILIIEKRERELVEKYIIKNKIFPKTFSWISQDLGKFVLIKFSSKEELITKLSFCLDNYRNSERKYIGEFIKIDKIGDF